MSQVKKRLKVLTNATKIAIIEERKAGNIQNKNLALKYGIKESSISKLWKKREKYENLDRINRKSKKIVKPKYQAIENAVIYSFGQWRDHKIPVTGSMLKSKALKFAEMLGISTFKGK